MANAAKNTELEPAARTGWTVKLLPVDGARPAHVSILMHEQLGWAIVQMDDGNGWGAVNVHTGELVYDRGHVRVWESIHAAMRELEHLCPDCAGSVGEVMKRLAPCATCDGTGEI